ncbi:MAG: DUF6174 domain-containing protein [Armatimonadota bacterium]
MTRRAVLTILLSGLGALGIAGCSGARSKAFALEEGLERWSRNRPRAYRYEISLLGFLPANRYRVEVKAGATRGTVTVIEGPDIFLDTSAWDSIDGLFATALRVVSSGGKASIEFAPDGFVPKLVRTDPLPGAIDDEVDYKVSAFEAL